jgi:hypothetical protein
MTTAEYRNSNVWSNPIQYKGEMGKSLQTRYKEPSYATTYNKDTST